MPAHKVKLVPAAAKGKGLIHGCTSVKDTTSAKTGIFPNSACRVEGSGCTLSLTNFWPSTLVVTSTWSTMPLSLWRRLLLTSRLLKRWACPGVSSGRGVVLPMMTSSPAHRKTCQGPNLRWFC